MTTVYMVTTGQYSNYSVLVAFTTEELAMTYAESKSGSVEALEVFDRFPTSSLRFELTGYVRADGIHGSPLGNEPVQMRSYVIAEYEGPIEHKEDSWHPPTGGVHSVRVTGSDLQRVKARFKQLVVEAWPIIPHEPPDLALPANLMEPEN